MAREPVFWIWAKEGGQRVVCGPFRTEQEAYSYGYTEFDGRVEVVPLNTVDRRRASAELRARFADEVGVVPALQHRFKHRGVK